MEVEKPLFVIGCPLSVIRYWQVAEKALLLGFAVIPAEAGIQYSNGFPDSRLRGSDAWLLFSATCWKIAPYREPLLSNYYMTRSML